MRKNIKFYSVTAILISCIACFTACGTGEKIVEKETRNGE